MSSLISFFGSGLFFTPFIYVIFYLLIDKYFNKYIAVKYILIIFTIFFGFLLIIFAYKTQPDFRVLMPSRGGAKNYVSASIFLVIVGAAIMALPLYGRYIKFSNSND